MAAPCEHSVAGHHVPLRPAPRRWLDLAGLHAKHSMERPATPAGIHEQSSWRPFDMPGWRFKLLYDGECPFCRGEVEWLKRRDRAGGLATEDIAALGFDPAPSPVFPG
jgi:hypothetical protein